MKLSAALVFASDVDVVEHAGLLPVSRPVRTDRSERRDAVQIVDVDAAEVLDFVDSVFFVRPDDLDSPWSRRCLLVSWVGAPVVVGELQGCHGA